MLRHGLIASFAFAVLAGVVSAQEEEIVVTAQRQSYSDYTDTPHVTLTRRADNMITTVNVVCDTRDTKQREEELRQTLRNLIAAAAGNGGIALSVGDEILVDFNETMLDKVIRPDAQKPETSEATIVVKTAIMPDDTFDTATGRIEAFVEATEKSGRTEVLITGDFNLSIVGPERNRPELLHLIAEDARQTAAALGQSFQVKLSGLQNQIEWYQTGQLDLSLYIRYAMEVSTTQP